MSDTSLAPSGVVDVRSGAEQPIVPGFHPDPTICRVGGDYYLASSSFEYFPGAPIFHSRDLVTWTQIGNVLDRRSQFRLMDAGPSTGVYGSTLRHHDGLFWFATTNVSDFSAGQVIVHATDPAGPWSDPVFVPEAVGIDPDLAWDGDTAYLTWHQLDFVVGGQGIRQAPVDLRTGALLEPSYPVWQGSGMPMAEGPHLYAVDDWWYLVLAEGGTERGHCVTVARSRSPRGPFASCPANPILTHRSSSHPVQNVGHADLVERADGTWAAAYLGARPRGSTPAFHVLGRETFLAGIDWVDGWPVFREDAFDVAVPDTSFVDDFSAPRLDPRWVVPDGDAADILVRPVTGGVSFMRSDDAPASLLCARVQDFAWHATADAIDAGALVLRIDDRHWCAVRLEDGVVRVVARIGDVSQMLGEVAAASDRARLSIAAMEPFSAPAPFGHAGPDDLVLGVEVDGAVLEIARIDGRYFSTEVAAGFTGRMLAVGSPSPAGRIVRVAYTPR